METNQDNVQSGKSQGEALNVHGFYTFRALDEKNTKRVESNYSATSGRKNATESIRLKMSYNFTLQFLQKQ